METAGGYKLECPHCSKKFAKKDKFARHVATHDPDARVKCEICGKMLKNASLSSHMKHLHGNPARIACTTCPKTFSTAGYFRQHLATIHSLVERPRYPCTFPGCTKSYLDHGHIAKHIKMEHVQNPARFPCTLCGKEFKAKKDLGRHIGKHTKEKSHVCGTCGRGFREMSDLRGHEVTHQNKATRTLFQCQLCPRTCFRSASLRQHIRTMHEKERNYVCRFCDKKFMSPEVLRNHERNIHSTNQDDFPSCDKCGYKTFFKHNLRRHMKRHETESGFDCYFCGKNFIIFTRLVKHSCRLHTMEKYEKY
ncbi:oocyte zinc finger protein XlCOF26-like isoform X2 [Folsomia candida]|nr:oocyte zinc finger protein XlCOF26-like isoform X2 [Folsomia candida]